MTFVSVEIRFRSAAANSFVLTFEGGMYVFVVREGQYCDLLLNQ
ncbi:Protein of unknown function [Bacillus cereus]|nr:Protein of unknown function [Bacillus cereus]SCN35927.1 Protein of unknown function [Bacillus wiedmannii]